MSEAYAPVTSELGPNGGKWDNSSVMAEILALRHELAQLLGFKNYAEKSLATKMAENPQQVLDFLNDLAGARPSSGEQEVAQLAAFAKEHYALINSEPWDMAYFADKQNSICSLSVMSSCVRTSRKKRISGLFEVIRRIYGITAKERFRGGNPASGCPFL